jgi:hypothetical protein
VTSNIIVAKISIFEFNNAAGRNYKDGFVLCNVQAVIFHYVALALAMSWTLQAVDLFCKVVLNMKSTAKHFPYHMFCIFALPLPLVIYNIVGAFECCTLLSY